MRGEEGGGEGRSLPKHMRKKDLEQPWVTENAGVGFLRIKRWCESQNVFMVMFSIHHSPLPKHNLITKPEQKRSGPINGKVVVVFLCPLMSRANRNTLSTTKKECVCVCVNYFEQKGAYIYIG